MTISYKVWRHDEVRLTTDDFAEAASMAGEYLDGDADEGIGDDGDTYVEVVRA